MRALFDVNFLIALLDSDHASHESAQNWFGKNSAQGWASCPSTQNGCVRIMSTPRYTNPLPIVQVVTRLREATSLAAHEFWPDSVSILDEESFDATRLHGPRQVTDAYLLGLAVARQGRLITFDAGISLAGVHGAKPHHLVQI